ncbi:hypothetical protein A4X06_0g5314 [Tilletia controversa]|uniref:TATA-binding protein-associated factor MOT1 n=1 Tax=Tilletia controversa TaxID=13291 RepID=A0A8X7MRN7_9BASI|nr:hypothetical protein CF328_g4643 [Tilletia controversa]KAE8245934.1 hypothetical protein A4X06_0g5314 [Tilletia controversa]
MASTTTSRLDRLVSLLDTGSTSAIRSSAAKQLGQIAERAASSQQSTENSDDIKVVKEGGGAGASASDDASPPTTAWTEGVLLLAKIVPLLRSRVWETRLAAANAVGAVCDALPLWLPSPSSSSSAEPPTPSPSPLASFNLPRLLSSGTKLLSSAGKEFESTTLLLGGKGNANAAERLAHAKRSMQSLGLSVGGIGDLDLGMDVEAELRVGEESGEGVKKNGAAVAKEGQLQQQQQQQQQGSAVDMMPDFSSTSALSARERNALKRKLKAGGGNASTPTDELSNGPPRKRQMLASDAPSASASPTPTATSGENANGNGNGNSSVRPASADAFALLNEDPTSWPFEPICALLAADLFNPSWEIRHGAALGLRELMRAQGSGCGLYVDGVGDHHAAFLEDVGVRLLSVCALDRLNDFVLDQVMAPVRETCAQALASLLLLSSSSSAAAAEENNGARSGDENRSKTRNGGAGMPLTSVQAVHRALVQMIRQDVDLETAARQGSKKDIGISDPTGTTFRRKRGDPGYAWEVRHAGFLGLKYEVSARMDVLFDEAEEQDTGGSGRVKKEGEGEDREVSERSGRRRPNAYFFEVIELAVLGLRDEDDDIRSAAASTLLALAPVLGSSSLSSSKEQIPIPVETTTRVLDTLWDSLAEAEGDDLGSSMASIMDLLAKLMEYENVQGLMMGRHPMKAEPGAAPAEESSLSSSLLAERIRTLHPYFRHTITSVRLSVLRAMAVFLRMGTSSSSTAAMAAGWIDAALLRLLFQNLIVEERNAVREASVQAWKAAVGVLQRSLSHLPSGTAAAAATTTSRGLVDMLAPYVPHFFQLIMTPLGSPVDSRLLYRPSRAGGKGSSSKNGNGPEGPTYDLDKGILSQDLALVGVDTVMHGRLGAAAALGQIMKEWPDQQHEVFAGQLLQYLDSSSALHKCLASCIIQEWAQDQPSSRQETSPLASELSARLIAILEAPAPPTYAEMEVALSRLQRESQSLYSAFHTEARVARDKIPTLPTHVDALGQRTDAFTLDTARYVVGPGYEALLKLVGSKSKKANAEALETRRRRVIASLGFYQSRKERSDVQVFAGVASALVALRVMPAKLNPVVRSMMNSVKFEENADLQAASARSVARFIKLCGESPGRTGDPSEKIVKNLCAFVCQDTTRTAVFSGVAHIREGIMSLDAEIAASNAPKSGRSVAGAASAEVEESEEVRQGRLIRRGAERALSELAMLFGAELFERVPAFRAAIYGPLSVASASNGDKGTGPSSPASDLDGAIAADQGVGQGIIDACTILEVIIPHVDPALHPALVSILGQLMVALQSQSAAIRSASARCYGASADVMTEAGMLELVLKVVPLLGDATNVFHRSGAMELILDIVRRLETKLLPYVIFFVVPVLGRMTDPDDKVRLAATNAFASLVKMVPLEAGLPDPAGFPADMLARRQDERKFLDQLLNGKVEEYRLPVKVNASLRKYQREGISWMAFLSKFKLHGILCDDMGLGKTLQSITILSCDHFERAQAYKINKTPEFRHLPSLVVCPSTLTGHWFHEIQQYSNNLRPVQYIGNPNERARIQGHFKSHDVVITSYDIVRNDVSILSAQNWNYCILDEGHIIKGSKTKTTKAVKSLQANHRLILSGTPIQNSVLELWSLFDFLMPGFLGTERSFQERYGKPILASREGKVTAKEQEAATLALEALHKQVLPFLLRRMKDDVLDDLPPKIIQDIECDLGEIQQALYDDFTSSQDRAQLEDALEEDKTAAAETSSAEPTPAAGSGPVLKQHAFQSLQYLRKLVNHPILVLDKTNPRHAKFFKRVEGKGGAGLRDIAHAPKLQVLKQLLNDCGIGLGSAAGAGVGAGPGSAKSGGTEGDLLSDAAAVSQHRVLIFCQLRQMLDVIEKDLFGTHMPSVTYMRLDGTVSADKRHGIVRTFNSDPSIDVLLLTTSVGGLGLTLTGADTVIFVEHDWNPMKDLQAMDRAHRLGQKKVVNVYRLITRNTLEQKIMGLQRFKLNVANSVITQDNATLSSMDTDGILDLFGPSSSSSAAGTGSAAAAAGGAGKKLTQKQLLDQLQNMPDTEEDEYREMTSWKPT